MAKWPKGELECPACGVIVKRRGSRLTKERNVGYLGALLMHLNYDHYIGNHDEITDRCLICPEEVSRWKWVAEAKHYRKNHTYQDLCKTVALAVMSRGGA